MIELTTILEQLARGGGGGSGGGGGGGGFSGGDSGGSGSGGGLGLLPIILGYAVASFVVAKLSSRTSKPVSRVAGLAVGIGLASVVGTLSVGIGVLIGIGVIAGVIFGTFNLNGIILAQVKNAKKQLLTASSKDKGWDEAALRKRIEEVFYAYQKDWSSFDLKHMQTYLDPQYFAHMQLVLQALQSMGRRNDVKDPMLKSVDFWNVTDQDGVANDSFQVMLTARADDQLLDVTNNNDRLYLDTNEWREHWIFTRAQNTWLLKDIKQLTESTDAATTQLRNFAATNSFFYNADFGWLLLPKRGQLFSGASFTNSDVNNHVIGVHKNVLVQFYSYVPARGKTETYVIAQAVLPKTYGNIVVRQKKGWFKPKIRGLNAISMEAREFNDKYEVFADDVEQVTSFELLHPAYMVKLIELGYEVNIEVVDNVLYLYSPDSKASYDSMLQLLKAAFEELKI